MDINFELYKIFYYTASSESFSEAAEKLFITQSAVSQSIKNLECRIGSQLFFRGKKSTKLTLEGEILFRHIEQAYNFIKTAENKLFELQNLKFGEIRIGSSDTICKYFLLPHLKSFNQNYPNIKILLLNRTSVQIMELLKNGLIDLGITTMPFEDKNVLAQSFIELEDIFVASSKFNELSNNEIELSKLSVYPLLLLDKNSTTRKNLDKYFETLNIKIIPKVEAESVDLLIEMAIHGFGISHVLKESADEYIRSGELFQVKIKETLPVRKLGIITLNNVPLSTAANEFLYKLKS